MPETSTPPRCQCGEDLAAAGGPDAACARCGRPRPVPGSPSRTTVVLAGESLPPETGGPGVAHPPPPETVSLVGLDLDHFPIVGEGGRGGSGTVHRAIGTSLDRPVAFTGRRRRTIHDFVAGTWVLDDAPSCSGEPSRGNGT